MVLSGSRTFSLVLGSQCFLVVLVGSHRFSVFSQVLSGSQWFSHILTGSRFSMFLSGSCWFS